MRKPWAVWIIIPIVLLAGVLRGVWLDHRCLFFDEIWHMELSTGRGSAHLRLPIDQLVSAQPNPVMLKDAPPWWAIWTHMDWVIHPPFYHFTLRAWRTIFGESGTVARAWSAVCSVLAVLVLFDVTRRQLGTTTALWAAAIMAASGTQITLAQDVRGYPLLLLLGLMACWITVWIETRGPSIWAAIVLGVVVLATMLTHYFAAGAIAGLFAYALIRLRDKARKQVAAAMVLAGVVFVFTWGPTLWAQMSHVHDTADIFLTDRGANHFTDTLSRLAAQPARMLLVTAGAAWPVVAVGGAVMVIAALRLRGRPALLLWAMWFGGAVGLVALLDFTRHTWHMEFLRYTVIASPAVCILLAAPGRMSSAWLRHGVPATTLVLCLAMVRAAYTPVEYLPDFDLRPAAAYLDSIGKSGEPIMFFSLRPDGQDGQYNYLGMALYSHLLPRPVLCITKPIADEVLSQLPPGRDLLIHATASQLNVEGLEILEQQSFTGSGVCLRIRLPRANQR